MEIPQIDEVKLGVEVEGAEQKKKVRIAAPEGRKCIYNKDAICQAPDCKMQICEKCPYGAQATFGAALKDVFKKIVSIAIFLAKSDDVLRDVMAMVSKGDASEGQGLRDLPDRQAGEGSGAGVKAQDIAGTPRPEIKKIAPKIQEDLPDGPIVIKPMISKKPVLTIGDVQKQMSNTIVQKMAGIDEALANPEGEGEAPLI